MTYSDEEISRAVEVYEEGFGFKEEYRIEAMRAALATLTTPKAEKVPNQLIDQARGYLARTWTAQGWRAEQSLDHPGYWDVWTLDTTGQHRIILARFLTANTAALMCFVSTGMTQLCDLAEKADG